MTKTVGITLCGGGVRGLSQIGVLHILEKAGISPDYVSGSSIGAIIGAFYADGFSPEEILEISKQSTMIKIFTPSLKFQGISNLNYLESLLKKHLRAGTFEELKKKFFVAATNLNTGKLDIFNTGELTKPVMASSAVPLIFEPQQINGYKYVDASILNNMPVEPVRPHVDILIGVYVHSHDAMQDPEKLSTWREVFDRAVSLSLWEKSKHQLEQCDFVIQPKKSAHHGLFNKKDDEALFKIGAEETEKHIPEILKALNHG